MDIDKDIDEMLAGQSSNIDQDIDSILGQLQTKQPRPEIEELVKNNTTGGTSPLSLGERFKYSLGNQAGRRAYLENKFPDRKITQLKSGKLAVDGIPIDPGGFRISDLAGDIVDIGDELVRLGGQILGGVQGTAISPGVGTVVGGAAGRAAGQGAVEVLGRAFGMQQEEIGQVVKDIATEGAIGAAGETIGLGIKAISKPTARFLRNLMERVSSKVGLPIEQTTINFTSGVPDYSVKRLQERGFKNIMTKQNLSDDALLKVGKDIQDMAITARKELGKVVETGKGIIRGMEKANIDVSDLRQDFASQMQNIGLLDKEFKLIKPAIGKLDTGQKELFNIFNLLKKTKKISPSTALQWRNELDRIIDFGRTGKLNISSAENALAEGLRGQLKQKLIEVSSEFAKANADFSAFAGIEDALKGKLDLQNIENFLKGIFSGQHFYEENLVALSRYTKNNFMPRVKDVVAAHDFAPALFRGIRSGLFTKMIQNITALGGLGFLTGGPAGSAAGILGGIAVSTPRIAATAIGKRQASAKFIEQLLQKTGQGVVKASPQASSTILSDLFRSSPR